LPDLKGLKSSLTCTGVLFLMGRDPKNGLGGAGTDSLGLGEARLLATAAPGLGDETTLGFGLNDDAFTLSLFAAAVLGEAGGAPPAGLAEAFARFALAAAPFVVAVTVVEVEVVPFVDAPAAGVALAEFALPFPPLNGGMI
jgi:hypothetical protein